MNKKQSVLALTFEEFLNAPNLKFRQGKYQASIIYREIFKKGNVDVRLFDELSNLHGQTSEMNQWLQLRPPEITHVQRENSLIKFVTALHDGHDIETVIVPMTYHKTLCISSQVGCRMGCRFCETGRLGFKRNLTVEEIVGQVYAAKFYFRENIRNVVFMGMGEPLDNMDNVVQAIRVMNDQRGLDIPKKYITLSTAGVVDSIEKIASLNWPDLNLAISLNASNDNTRSKLMPINNIWPMSKLQQSLHNYSLRKKSTLFIEYILIKDVNDSRLNAKELALYVKPLKAKLNIIPLNPCTGTAFKQPSEDGVNRFRDWLIEEKIFVRKRAVKGRDIMAACGQLGNRNNR